MNFDPKWLEAAQQFQKNMMDSWTQALGSASSNPGAFGMPLGQMPQMPSMAGMTAPDFGQLKNLLSAPGGAPAKIDPAKALEIQTQSLRDVAGLWNQGLEAQPTGDRRFANDAWTLFMLRIECALADEAARERMEEGRGPDGGEWRFVGRRVRRLMIETLRALPSLFWDMLCAASYPLLQLVLTLAVSAVVRH